MAVPLLDTHAWIWWIEGDRRLQRRVRDTLDRLPPHLPLLTRDVRILRSRLVTRWTGQT